MDKLHYLAHVAEDGREQTVLAHLEGTAALCAAFAAGFDAGEQGRLAGLAHDIGKYSDAFRKKSGSEFRCFSGDLWDSGSAVVTGLFVIPDPTGQTQKTKTEKSKQKSIRRQQKPSQIISCSKHCQYHFMKDVGLERKPCIPDTASGLGNTA